MQKTGISLTINKLQFVQLYRITFSFVPSYQRGLGGYSLLEITHVPVIVWLLARGTQFFCSMNTCKRSVCAISVHFLFLLCMAHIRFEDTRTYRTCIIHSLPDVWNQPHSSPSPPNSILSPSRDGSRLPDISGSAGFLSQRSEMLLSVETFHPITPQQRLHGNQCPQTYIKCSYSSKPRE